MELTNKSYIKYSLYNSSIFDGYVENYEVSEDISKKLAKDIGFSYDLYNILLSIDEKTAHHLVNDMSRMSHNEEIVLLLSDTSVLGYSLDTDRLPILNSEFIKRVSNLVDTSDSVELGEIYYDEDSTISSVIIKKKDPIVVEEQYTNSSKSASYTIGILLSNDELGNVTSRLVLYINKQPLYLPASIYSTTTARYKRSTASSIEALEVLVLKVLDDLRDDLLKSKIYEVHIRYRYNKNILSTYEEYNELLKILRKIPTIIEDSSYLYPVLDLQEEFEKRYINLIDQKSSYIWRCTAIGDTTIDKLTHIVCDILNDACAPSLEYFHIRERLGSYISTPRIAEDIAKDSSV